MLEWEFKRLAGNRNGRTIFAELSLEQKQRVELYSSALRTAFATKVPNPVFSRFFVREAIGIADKKILAAGNIEYGLCKALHGEETAIAALRSRFGSSAEKPVLAIVGEASPCGNCRDIMRDNLGPDAEIVAAVENNAQATVSIVKDYLFDAYKTIPRMDYMYLEDLFISNVWETVRVGERLTNDAYSPGNIHPERKYSALLAAGREKFFGARDVMCDYHPIYALTDAVRQARRSNNPFINYAIIVSEEGENIPPDVLYQDRQHLYELNLQQELLLGKSFDPKVYLAAQRAKGYLGRVWQTSVKEWLPFPFSPKNFGEDFIQGLKAYYQKKTTI